MRNAGWIACNLVKSLAPVRLRRLPKQLLDSLDVLVISKVLPRFYPPRIAPSWAKICSVPGIGRPLATKLYCCARAHGVTDGYLVRAANS